MINLEQEKKISFTTQQVYDVVSFAVQAADDNGFINSFILERALYEYMILLTLKGDEKTKLSSLVAQNVNEAWTYLLENDVLPEFIEEHGDDIDYVAEVAANWSKEYAEYAHSARGVLAVFQTVTGNLNQVAAEQLQKIADGDEAKKVLRIANEWGLDRKPEDATDKLTVVDGGKQDEDSLFDTTK